MFCTYRNEDIRRDEISSFLNLGSLNGKCMGEMYLDTTNTFNGSHSLSPTSSETQMSPDLLNAFVSPSPLYSSTPISNVANSSVTLAQPRPLPRNFGYFNGAKGVMTTNTSHHSMHTANTQPHPIEKCNTYGKNRSQSRPPYRIADGELVQKQQKNEISKSLKTFAMLASYDYGNDLIQIGGRDSPVDDIMQDFYCNGYVTDDFNLYRQGNASIETASIHGQHCPINDSNSNNGIQNNLNFNITNYGKNNGGNANNALNNYNDGPVLNSHYFNPNFWMMPLTTPSPFCGSGVRSQALQQHAASATASAAATAAAAANIDYNSQNIKKPAKRYGNTKFDKVTAVKHCVFCENNNEPEAVVKSHAVRDSLGRVLCPKLRTYICPICKASGDKAHTVKYCPQKPIITMEDAVKAESLRLSKNSYYKQGMKV